MASRRRRGSAPIRLGIGLDGFGALNERWRCQEVDHNNDGKPDEDKYCKIEMPFIRFNVSPRNINGVFLDRPDLNNPAYAIYVAFGARHMGDICRSQPSSYVPPYTPQGYSMAIAN